MVDQEAEVCPTGAAGSGNTHQLVLHKVKMVVEEIEMFHQVQTMLEEEGGAAGAAGADGSRWWR